MKLPAECPLLALQKQGCQCVCFLLDVAFGDERKIPRILAA